MLSGAARAVGCSEKTVFTIFILLWFNMGKGAFKYYVNILGGGGPGSIADADDANRNRREKTFILCRFFSGKAKLVRAEKYRYHIVVKWYLLKMDLGF